MTSFKQFLNEFRPNTPQGQMMDSKQILNMKNGATQLKWVIFVSDGVNTELDIVVFDCEGFGSYDKFIILAERKNQDQIIGYAWLNNKISDGQYWQIKDIAIYPKYQKKGIGTNLYIKLAKEGYKIMNGFSLSAEVEKVWRKLPEYVNVYTWDKETNELNSMDERPKEDNNIDDGKQRYFWVALEKPEALKESQWHSVDDEWFNKFLKGEFSPSFGSDWFEGTY